jgi:hypothetical protein
MSEETPTNNTETTETEVSRAEQAPAVTARQLAANRENAMKSTGPRTVAGKIRSSRNALKHGRYCGQSKAYSLALYSRMQELGEDPVDFAEIEDGLRTSFLPSNKAEQMVVHQIALLQWQRQRLERAEAALLARRIQKLEIEREREILMVKEKMSTQIHTAQLQLGLLWQKEESATKYQKLLEFLETLLGCVDLKNYEPAEAVLGWIYGPVPSVRGAHIKALFQGLVQAGPKAPPDKSALSTLRLELLREISDIASQYKLYRREHTDLTPTMLDERLAPTGKQRTLLNQMSIIDRRIDQKIRLLLTLQKAAAERLERDYEKQKGSSPESREEGSPAGQET